MRRLLEHVPNYAIESRALARRKIRDHLAFGVENLELEPAVQVPRSLVVADCRPVGRIVADEDSRARWIARSRTATSGTRPPLNCAQRSPPSIEMYRPNSVPRNSRLRLCRSSLIT